MISSISLTLPQLVVIFALFFVLVLAYMWRSEIQTELRFIKLDISTIQKDLQINQMIQQQVLVAGSAGEKTISNLNITSKLSSILLKRFTVDELKSMAHILNLNGSIDWTTKQTATRTILQHMYTHDRLIEVLRYIDTERPDIKL